MPHGFFTVEQWQGVKYATTGWKPILHLDSHQSLTKAIGALEKRGKAGLYRIVQMQRCIWAERQDGKLRVYASHASSPANLKQLTVIYSREGGRWPREKARQARAEAKAKRAKRRR
jgi:hypothetical protein